MKSKDRIKEEIGLNKLLITIFSAVDFSLISWIWRNYDSNLKGKDFLVYLIVIFFSLFLLVILQNTLKKIKKIDEYD